MNATIPADLFDMKLIMAVCKCIYATASGTVRGSRYLPVHAIAIRFSRKLLLAGSFTRKRTKVKVERSGLRAGGFTQFLFA